MRRYPISVRLSPAIANRVDDVAASLQISLSQLLEALLHDPSPWLESSPLHRDDNHNLTVVRRVVLGSTAASRLMHLAGYREIRPGDFAWDLRPGTFLRGLLSGFVAGSPGLSLLTMANALSGKTVVFVARELDSEVVPDGGPPHVFPEYDDENPRAHAGPVTYAGLRPEQPGPPRRWKRLGGAWQQHPTGTGHRAQGEPTGLGLGLRVPAGNGWKPLNAGEQS
jgi:hypothetical protein